MKTYKSGQPCEECGRINMKYDVTLIEGKDYISERMMDIINNPKPLQKPPYSCGESHRCVYPNCTCEWRL